LILSDSHGFWDPAIIPHIKASDEVWHAGDIGNTELFLQWCNLKTLRMVAGNIDQIAVQKKWPDPLVFLCEQTKVLICHKGGKPGNPPASIKPNLVADAPDILVCGHSHLCQIAPNRPYSKFFINPGACGKEGFHFMRTMVTLKISGGDIFDVAFIELGKRSAA